MQRTPANVGVIGEALIYEQDATVLGDVLKNVSGLNIQNGSGVHDYFVLRGFNSVDGGLLMTDGVAEPEVEPGPLRSSEGTATITTARPLELPGIARCGR